MSGLKTLFRTQITDTWTTVTDGDNLGDLRWEGTKCYKVVQFNNGVDNIASIAGHVAMYYAVSGSASATTGYLSSIVTMDRTDSSSIGAGVFQGVVTDGDHCWLQIKGQATLLTASLPSGSDGNAMTTNGAAADGALIIANADGEEVCAIIDDASLFEIICDFKF